MQPVRSPQLFSVSPLAVSRPRHTVLAATRGNRNVGIQSDRREVVVSLAGMGLFWFGDALAMDANDAKAAKERRRRALRAAAEEMKQEGVAKSAFSRSKYSMAEDKTPNIHSRQEEGKRTQVNA